MRNCKNAKSDFILPVSKGKKTAYAMAFHFIKTIFPDFFQANSSWIG